MVRQIEKKKKKHTQQVEIAGEIELHDPKKVN